MEKLHRSHGTGAFEPSQLRALGEGCVFEAGVLVFHPENISLGRNVYVGHYAILKGYYKNEMVIGDQTWIGQQCFFHSAGGLVIGQRVGIGPGVKILTSVHEEAGRAVPVLFSPVATAPVHIEDDSDLGINSVVLPGVTVGRGAIVGAGAVCAQDVPPYAVVAGVPARVLRYRA
ncbi:MAG: transferase [Deltaproteobacteria bacterium]|nr:transferase [Deltaproteobacteria bacterium]